jgi:hypothetical protein
MKPALLGATLAMLAAAPLAHAQWANVADGAFPRTAAGEPDFAAPAPRAPDGRPDLSGIWLADRDPPPADVHFVEGDQPFSRHFINVFADLPPAEVPMQPWAAQLFEERLASDGVNDPLAHCKPTGLPILNAAPLPYKIVQAPRMVLILYEENTVFRQIFLDARVPVEDAVPRWMGYSTGRWDDDTLIVETVGFHDRHWLDAAGHPNSDKLRLIERFRRPSAGRLEIQTTIDDAGAYTKPVVYTVQATALPDEDLLEYFCTENEKDAQHYQ